MRKFLFLFLGVMLFRVSLTQATTYVIEEDGVEVGRWEESDGKDTVEVISNSKPKASPQPIEPPKPLTHLPGYQFEKVEIPEEGVLQWRMAGQVLDFLTLKPVSSGSVVFSGAAGEIELPVAADGFFRGKVPALAGGSAYTIFIKPPEGYESNTTRIFPKGGLRNVPYAERIKRIYGIEFTSGGLNGNHYDIQIGLIRTQLSDQERQDYQLHAHGRSY